jgi:hypothetical protein
MMNDKEASKANSAKNGSKWFKIYIRFLYTKSNFCLNHFNMIKQMYGHVAVATYLILFSQKGHSKGFSNEKTSQQDSVIN